MTIEKLENWYQLNFENQLQGRRILFNDIEPILLKLSNKFQKEIIGYSESGTPIYMITLGTGPKKVLTWSQMHGNESTGTKALFDLFKLIENPTEEFKPVVDAILTECTLKFIVLLNPDGSVKFTRENLNDIDLNRDAVDRKAVESNLLRTHLDTFNPEFCFNLHDQRSIFNVEGTPNPATISFLAPSEDLERTITKGRTETMSVIVSMNELLQKAIPNHIGRYTDEFYPTATGDNFQKLGHNTILIEAGHYQNDYARDIVRKFNFFAILQGLYFIATSKTYDNYQEYFKIPNNDKKFLDYVYKNITINENNEIKVTDIGIQLKFKVIDGELVSYKAIECTGNLSDFYTNNCINAEKMNIKDLKLSNS
ncbi:MAG: zinc carboxypeptidase [Lutibacter sp.]|nr:zinc carboxypeptidase [Lutibacter sp.]